MDAAGGAGCRIARHPSLKAGQNHPLRLAHYRLSVKGAASGKSGSEVTN
jgi:hypothetical protein